MKTIEQKAMADLLRSELVIAVLRGNDPDSVYEDARSIIEGGLHTIEITMTVPGAVDVIQRLVESTDAIIGAGSVRTATDANRCLNAGAQFIVSPTCSSDVICRVIERNAVVIPGAMTPTEVLTAWELGADFVKIFPEARLGPEFLSDLLGPLPEIPLVPTGGITNQNMVAYLDAGAALVCVGSWLTVGDREETQRRSQLISTLVEEHKERHRVDSP